MKIVFRPSFDEHVELVTARQRARQSNSTKALTWTFFAFNLAIVPALLLFLNFLWFALAIFAVNVLLWIVMLPREQKNAMRKYYEDVWPDLEKHDCEIEIAENGLSCKHAGNHNFYPWKNIKSVRANDHVVYFDLGWNHVLASKRAFATKEELDHFMHLADQLRNGALSSEQ